MAFTDLRVVNFTITGSLVFKNTTYPSRENNYAFCKVRLKQHLPDYQYHRRRHHRYQQQQYYSQSHSLRPRAY